MTDSGRELLVLGEKILVVVFGLVLLTWTELFFKNCSRELFMFWKEKHTLLLFGLIPVRYQLVDVPLLAHGEESFDIVELFPVAMNVVNLLLLTSDT